MVLTPYKYVIDNSHNTSLLLQSLYRKLDYTLPISKKSINHGLENRCLDDLHTPMAVKDEFSDNILVNRIARFNCTVTKTIAASWPSDSFQSVATERCILKMIGSFPYHADKSHCAF